jgi:hypothetical protein
MFEPSNSLGSNLAVEWEKKIFNIRFPVGTRPGNKTCELDEKKEAAESIIKHRKVNVWGLQNSLHFRLLSCWGVPNSCNVRPSSKEA